VNIPNGTLRIGKGATDSSHWLNIAVALHGLPQRESPVNHAVVLLEAVIHSPRLFNIHMMEPEDRIKRRVVQIRHMSVVASDGMDDIVKRLQTVGVCGAARDPRLITELGEVSVRREEVVQAVSGRDLIVCNLRGNEIVLADCRS